MCYMFLKMCLIGEKAVDENLFSREKIVTLHKNIKIQNETIIDSLVRSRAHHAGHGAAYDQSPLAG